MKQQNDGSDTKLPELTRKPFSSQNVMHLQEKTNTVKRVTHCKKYKGTAIKKVLERCQQQLLTTLKR